jgi:ribosomal protein L29
MDLHKLNMSELKGLDQGALRQVEKDVRKSLLKIRMDIYTAKSTHGAKVRGLKKSLARVLTVQNQAKASASGANSPKAMKTK